jgi:hypothetical protein
MRFPSSDLDPSKSDEECRRYPLTSLFSDPSYLEIGAINVILYLGVEMDF